MMMSTVPRQRRRVPCSPQDGVPLPFQTLLFWRLLERRPKVSTKAHFFKMLCFLVRLKSIEFQKQIAENPTMNPGRFLLNTAEHCWTSMNNDEPRARFVHFCRWTWENSKNPTMNPGRFLMNIDEPWPRNRWTSMNTTMNPGRFLMNIDEHWWTLKNIDEPRALNWSHDEHRWTQRWTPGVYKTNDERRWTQKMNPGRFWWTTMNIDEHWWTMMNLDEKHLMRMMNPGRFFGKRWTFLAKKWWTCVKPRTFFSKTLNQTLNTPDATLTFSNPALLLRTRD